MNKPMNAEVLDVVNAMQQVLKALTMASLQLNPDAADRFAGTLEDQAGKANLHPIAVLMLHDLAAGARALAPGRPPTN